MWEPASSCTVYLLFQGPSASSSGKSYIRRICESGYSCLGNCIKRHRFRGIGSSLEVRNLSLMHNIHRCIWLYAASEVLIITVKENVPVCVCYNLGN
jgi:hypothetical protein